MASRLFASLAVLCLTPGVAAADGFGLGLGLGLPREDVVRPSYAESYDAFPPEQHNFLGMPVPPPSPYDRPSYREAYDDFPPAGGRYGGGFIEYLMTGRAPAAAPAYAAPLYASPSYAAPVYASPSYAAPVYAAPAAEISAPSYEPAPLYPPAAPAYAATAPSAATRRLPRSRLPEYAPDQPPASFGGS